jgi:PAS domain S-box-containing protein
MKPQAVPAGQDLHNAVDAATAFRAENAVLRDRLREAEETLSAIRNGEVDAVVVSGKDNVPKVYTLATADESYRLLVQEMHEGALTLSRAGDILYCNASLAALVGSESGKIIGGSLKSFISDDQWPGVLDMIATQATGEIEIAGGPSRLIPVHISFSALRGGHFDDEEVYCGIVTDLSEQRRTSDELRATHEALLRQVAEREHTERLLRQSQKMEAVGQLTGGIAHDFNNLLMVISGGLSILERDPAPERRRKLQEGMRQAAQRGAALTRQLLAFSRQKELNAIPIMIPRHVEGMRELLDGSLGGDLLVRMQFEPDVWPVEVDAGELEIALLNLCVNARDAMPGGGAIVIAGRNRPDFTDLQLKGDFVEVSVTDTGEGMDALTLSRCLEPFYTTKDVGKGSGLGLAQVYGFAKGSGGAVQIESTLRQGTTVSLFLPRSGSKVRAAQETAAVPLKSVPRCRVLLVEDDVAVATLTGEMLQELGYEVVHVKSGRAGLDFLLKAQDSIGLVLSDLMMPDGMDGMTFYRELRKANVQLPVVLASGYAESIRREADDAGIALLAKPYGLDELDKTLSGLLIRPDGGRDGVPTA